MAVPVTVMQMALLRNTEFMERVQATLAQACATVLNEPGTTPYHLGRAAYAQRVVTSPQTAAMMGGPQIVMGVNVILATTYDEATKLAQCSIADIDLEAQVISLWNSLAGLDTPS